MVNVHDRWSLTPVVNASGTMTSLGASCVLPEVAREVGADLGEFVLMDELQARASSTIARLTGSEAGFVTSSNSAAMTVAAAAAITGDDLAAIEALPDCGEREHLRRWLQDKLVRSQARGKPSGNAVAELGVDL